MWKFLFFFPTFAKDLSMCIHVSHNIEAQGVSVLWLARLIAKLMSGLVHSIAYIILPITLPYGTLFMYSISCGLYGHIFMSRYSPFLIKVSTGL